MVYGNHEVSMRSQRQTHPAIEAVAGAEAMGQHNWSQLLVYRFCIEVGRDLNLGIGAEDEVRDDRK